MELKNIIETINFELVVEGLGALCGISLLWELLFHRGLPHLLSLFLATIC